MPDQFDPSQKTSAPTSAQPVQPSADEQSKPPCRGIFWVYAVALLFIAITFYVAAEWTVAIIMTLLGLIVLPPVTKNIWPEKSKKLYAWWGRHHDTIAGKILARIGIVAAIGLGFLLVYLEDLG